MSFLLGSCWDKVRSTMNESVMVRSEEWGIYTLSRNLTVQIYVGCSDTDLGTSDLNRKHCSHRVRSLHEQVNVGTPDKHRDFRRSELPTYVGPSDMHRQSTSKALGVGTPDKVRDFRRAQTAGQQSHRYRDSRLGSGLPTIGSFNSHQNFRRPQSPRRLSDWESELPA